MGEVFFSGRSAVRSLRPEIRLFVLSGNAARACEPSNLRHFLVLAGCRADTSCRSSNNSGQMQGVTATVPDRLLPAVAFDAYLAEPGSCPALPERFLPPPDFVWGGFTASDGAVLEGLMIKIPWVCAYGRTRNSSSLEAGPMTMPTPSCAMAWS